LPAASLRSLPAEGHDLFDRPNGEAFGHDPMRKVFLRRRVLQGEQRASVTRAQDTRCDTALHGGREIQQADRVGDMRPRPPDPMCQLFMGRFEIVEELLICRCFLKGIQLLAVQVLDESVTNQLRQLTGAPAPLAHDYLESVGSHATNHDRLQQPNHLDRLSELSQGLVIEDLPWLPRVRSDRVHGDLVEVGATDTG
jgi:hypothetical protein